MECLVGSTGLCHVCRLICWGNALFYSFDDIKLLLMSRICSDMYDIDIMPLTERNEILWLCLSFGLVLQKMNF